MAFTPQNFIDKLSVITAAWLNSIDQFWGLFGGASTLQQVYAIFNPQTAAEVAAGVTPTNYQYPVGNILRYGADPSGTLDSTPAFTAANAVAVGSGPSGPRDFLITIPAGKFYLPNGFNFGPGRQVQGACNFPSTQGVLSTILTNGGSVLFCDNSFAGAVVVLGDGLSTLPTSISNVVITRSGTTAAPAGSIGLWVHGGNNVRVTDVYCANHSIGFFDKPDPAALGGFGHYYQRLFTSWSIDADFVVDTTPAVYLDQFFFGVNNGSGNHDQNTYFRLQGNVAGGGPNLQVTNGQANGTHSSHSIEFVNTGSGLDSIGITNCIFDGVFDAHIYTDSTCPRINGLVLSGCDFFGLVSTIFDFDPGTELLNCTFTGNTFNGQGLSLNSTGGLHGVVISGNAIYIGTNAITLTGNAGDVLIFDDNIVTGQLTVSGTFRDLQLGGFFETDGVTISPSFTISGSVDIRGDAGHGSWTPGISFGGATTGITYGLQFGRWRMCQNVILAEFTVILTSKGSATGAALVTGLPFPVYAGGGAGGGRLHFYSDLAGVAAGVDISANAGDSTAVPRTPGAVTQSSLTDANFTNTSHISGAIIYMWQP